MAASMPGQRKWIKNCQYIRIMISILFGMSINAALQTEERLNIISGTEPDIFTRVWDELE
jgi:hypothetical protein